MWWPSAWDISFVEIGVDVHAKTFTFLYIYREIAQETFLWPSKWPDSYLNATRKWFLREFFLIFKKFSQWSQFIRKKFDYTIMETSFPKENQDEWQRLFKPCASQRLFLPVSILTILYSFIRLCLAVVSNEHSKPLNFGHLLKAFS